NSACRIPGSVVRDDLLERRFAGENWRQHDAVVIAARLCAEQGDIVGAARRLEQMFEHAARCHAGPDDDELAGHDVSARTNANVTPPSGLTQQIAGSIATAL